MNVRMKFLCDYDRCIDCNGCSIACDSGHHLPLDVRRRKVYTFNEGKPGEEYSVSIACMHCTDAPCAQVCPVDCFYIRDDGIVLHAKDTCIACGYCLYACPYGAPQFPRAGGANFMPKGVMDKCTMCAGGPSKTHTEEEFKKYGQNRIAEGKVPLCAAMCSTKALIVGDAKSVDKIYNDRVTLRGYNTGALGTLEEFPGKPW